MSEARLKEDLLTEEIAREEWPGFFESFSLRHQGWLVTVEVFGSDIGAQVVARELPLDGIYAEATQDGAMEISVIVGYTPEQHVTHTITAPRRVILKRTEEGADEAIDIESDERKTLIRFRSAVPTELVDGIL